MKKCNNCKKAFETKSVPTPCPNCDKCSKICDVCQLKVNVLTEYLKKNYLNNENKGKKDKILS